MEYYESLRKGICPECQNDVIKVEETTEFDQEDQPFTYTVVRCTRCGKSWLPEVLIKR